MLVVDSMHCLLEGLAQFHFQEVLKLTNAAAKYKPKVTNTFDYDFPSPLCTKHITCADLKGDEIKQVSQIHALLLAPLPDDTVETRSSLMKALERKKKSPLVYVAESLGLMPDHPYEQQPHSFTKLCWARSLTTWVCYLHCIIHIVH